MKQVTNPGHLIPFHGKGPCTGGRDLFAQPVTDHVKRQVFAIPTLKIEVTEHQADIVRCACGTIHVVAFISLQNHASIFYRRNKVF